MPVPSSPNLDLLAKLQDAVDRARADRAAKADLVCPACGSSAYICTAAHTDGPGARLHCRSASMHNFPAPTADNSKD